MTLVCPHCSCTSTDGAQAHAVLAALALDDMDAALAQGLLEALECPGCEPGCNALIADARSARQIALAARDRHRAREIRLHRRKAERDAARVPKASPTQAPALPAAAAEVLARALAKARMPR
ncbi:hypothetical protein [Thermomonas sp.]